MRPEAAQAPARQAVASFQYQDPRQPAPTYRTIRKASPDYHRLPRIRNLTARNQLTAIARRGPLRALGNAACSASHQDMPYPGGRRGETVGVEFYVLVVDFFARKVKIIVLTILIYAALC